jgi:hypothetical protein
MALMGVPMVTGAALVTSLFCLAMGAISGYTRRFNALAATGLLIGLAVFLGGIFIEHVMR